MNNTITVRIVITCFLFLLMTPVFASAQSGYRGGGSGVSQHQRHQQRVQQQRVQQQRHAAAAARRAAIQRQEQQLREGVVVVELFTSQGCGSCPSADVALRQIVAVAERRKLKVYGLSFHVDYWNRLGWDDPYSQKDFTARQGAYAAKQQGNQLYTPQMIVNGTAEFLGSDKTKAHATITSALKEAPTSTIKLTVDNSETGVVKVGYRLGGVVDGNALNVAIVQTPPSNLVVSGENGGRKLKHVNVVRAFKVLVPEGDRGTVSLELPEGFDKSLGYDVVAYVQNKSSYAIFGADAVEVIALKAPSNATAGI